MSWLSDIFSPITDALGISDSIPDLSSIFGSSGSSSSGGSSSPWSTADIIKTATGGLGSLASVWNNSNNLDQTSKQWDAQFAYQQQRDKVNDAFNQAKLNEEIQAANIMAGAQVKAAGIAAAAQNRRTLGDEYANYMNQESAARRDKLQGYQALGDAMASPYTARRSLKY